MGKYDQLLIQANEHLRDVDAKRNRMYYFFIVILGLYLTFYNNIGSTEKLARIVLSTSLIILGIVMIFIIINYHIWHIIYVNTAIVIQKIINRDIEGPITSKIIEELFSETKNSNYKFHRRYGTEFFIYNSFLIFTFVPIGISIYQIVGNGIAHTLRIIFIIVVSFLIYVFLFNLVHNKMLEEAKENFLEWAWILRL